jgi:hypothetical protein
MPIEPDDVQAAIRHAINHYARSPAKPAIGQTWLKPICVLAIDHLAARLGRSDGRPFLCVNGLDTRREGTAWKWRRQISQNQEREYLSNLSIHPHECLVDMNLMIGVDAPYETLLTAESEGYEAHGRTVGQARQATDNDFLWDFYKLLQVPSPLRFMFSLCASKHQGGLVDGLDHLVRRYARLPEQLPPGTDIWSVSFPTSSVTDTPVRVHRWAPGLHTAGAADHSFLIGDLAR